MGNIASTKRQRARRIKIRRFRSFFDADTIAPCEHKQTEDDAFSYEDVGNELHASNLKDNFPSLCDGCNMGLTAKEAESLINLRGCRRRDSEIERIVSGFTRIQLYNPVEETDEDSRKVAQVDKIEIQDEESQAPHVDELTCIKQNKAITMLNADDVAVLLKGVEDQLCMLTDSIQRIIPKSNFAAETSPEARSRFKHYFARKVPSEDSFKTIYSGSPDNSDGLYEEPMLATVESFEELTIHSRSPPRVVIPPRYRCTISGTKSIHPRLPTSGRVKPPRTVVHRQRLQRIRPRAEPDPSETTTVADEESPSVPSDAVVATEVSTQTSAEASSPSMVTVSSAFSEEKLLRKAETDMRTIVHGGPDEGSADGRILDLGKGGSMMNNAIYFWKEGKEEAVGCWRCSPDELVRRMSPDSTPVIVKLNRACCSRCALHMPLILKISLAYPSFPFIVVDVTVKGCEMPNVFSFLAVQNGRVLARQVNVAPSDTKATFQYFASKFRAKSATQ